MTVSGLLLSGCANIQNIPESVPDTASETDHTFLTMEEDPELGYTVPVSSPHILIDELGYLPDSSKTVFFYGDELPGSFRIRDARSGETVFDGETEDRGRSELYETGIAYGDFSELTEEGIYYIEADLLGRSYDFEIREGIYDELFREACKTYYYNRCGMTLTEEFAGENAHNACHTGNGILRQDITVSLDVAGGWHQDGSGSKDIVTASRGLTNILLSYEIFGAAFTDDMGIPESGNGIPDILDEARYETDWMLKMQDAATGAVYSALTVSDQVIYVEEGNSEASYAFASVLAKFSYLYQSFDREYATRCLQAADRAWRFAVLNEKNAVTAPEEISQWKLPAAAEIYRASASGECENFLNTYFSEGFGSEDLNMVTFYGCSTYLNTNQKVNTRYCAEAIRVIMQRAEEISGESRNAAFAVPGNREQSNNNELLNKMMILTLVDHVITNHEYDMVIENYLHYFLGRNAMSVVYLDNVGTYGYKELNPNLGIMKQFESDSILVFMLSKMISKDGFIG